MKTKIKKQKSIISPYLNNMTKIKLEVLVKSIEALKALQACKLSAKVSYGLIRFISKIDVELKALNEARDAKLKEYGTPVEGKEGHYTGLFDETTKELTEIGKKFNAEVLELGQQEVELDIPEVKVDDLGDSKIEPMHLVTLEWLIKA